MYYLFGTFEELELAIDEYIKFIIQKNYKRS